MLIEYFLIGNPKEANLGYILLVFIIHFILAYKSHSSILSIVSYPLKNRLFCPLSFASSSISSILIAWVINIAFTDKN